MHIYIYIYIYGTHTPQKNRSSNLLVIYSALCKQFDITNSNKKQCTLLNPQQNKKPKQLKNIEENVWLTLK